MGSETLPSTCYILSDECSIPFYLTRKGYKYRGSEQIGIGARTNLETVYFFVYVYCIIGTEIVLLWSTGVIFFLSNNLRGKNSKYKKIKKNLETTDQKKVFHVSWCTTVPRVLESNTL